MSAVAGWLRVLLTPTCWVRIYRFSRVWDAELQRLIADHAPVQQLNEYEALIGPHMVWVENHPYASFTPGRMKVSPRRITTLRAMDYFEEALIAQRSVEVAK